jgi:YVTN family beta-propeller protein
MISRVTTRWHAVSLLFTAITSFAMFLTYGCGSNAVAPPPLPPSPPVATITVSQVSPNPVDTGEALAITFTGADPSAAGNPMVATFQQGSLPKQTGKFLGADSLGANQFRAFYQVPTGLGADAGALAIPMQMTLSNQQASTTAQNIQVAPPASIAIFPQEVYVGDINRILRISGIHTHFDTTTVVNATTGLQINAINVLSAQEIQVTVSVTATSAAAPTLQVQSGGTDPKTSESVAAPIVISPPAAPIFGANNLDIGDGAPGAVVKVQGLFIAENGSLHNLVEWDVNGHSFTTYPFAASSSELDVMVPLWPNSDGTIFSGPAQLKVISSGRTTQFSFTIDPLPSNSLANGVVLGGVLDSLQNSVNDLTSGMSAVGPTSAQLQALKAVTDQATMSVAQLRQWKDAVAGGQTVTLPGSQATLTPAALTRMEQLLLTSGLHTALTASLHFPGRLVPALSTAFSETAPANVASFCRATDQISKLSTGIVDILSATALIVALTGDIPLALTIEAMIDYFSAESLLTDILNAGCRIFPFTLTKLAFAPTSQHLTNALQPTVPFQLSGTFSSCDDPSVLFLDILNQLIVDHLGSLWGHLGDKILVDAGEAVLGLIGQRMLDFLQQYLQPGLSKFAGMPLPTSGANTIALTSGTIVLQSTNPGVGTPIPKTLQVQPLGPGTTSIYADVSKFLLGSQGNACNATQVSTDVQGNAASLTIDGPPITMPTGSGSTVGLVPVTTGGVTIEKGYIPIPNLQVVAVVDAGAPSGTAPLGAVIMPPGFVPNGTAADPLNELAYVTSYNSNKVVVIDATTDTVQKTLTLSVTHSFQFSFSSCMVCGAVIDFQNNLLVFDTAEGYIVYSNGTQLPLVPAFPAENFGYDSATHQIISPFYTKFNSSVNPLSGLQAIDAAGGAIENFSGFVGQIPDAAAVDPTTGIAVVANEPFTSTTKTGLLSLINLSGASVNGGSFSAPSSSFLFPDTSGLCSGFSQDEQNEWTMPAVEASTHTLFVASEFSNCVAVLDMQPIKTAGSPRVGASFRFSPMPISPDRLAWTNSLDPHGTAVFVSAGDGKSYGFLVRQDAAYVARIDLQGFLGAATKSGPNGFTDVSPFVTFLRTR